MKKERWINEVMSSLQGMQRAEGNPYLHTRVMARLEKTLPVKGYSWRPVAVLSAVLVLILFLNIVSWSSETTEDTQTSAITTEKEYELITLNY